MTAGVGRGSVSAGTSRRAAGLLAAVVLLVVAVAASFAFGSRSLSLEAIWDGLLHYNQASPEQLIVHQLRLPRTVLALAVGAAMGCAGALIQALTRNPLADPGVLGLNNGAALAVACAIAVAGLDSIWSYMWFSFVGAAIAAVVVYALGSLGRGGGTPIRLTLAGVAVGSVLSGITTGVVLLDPDTFDRMRSWYLGSVAGRDLSIALAVTPFIVVGLVMAATAARSLNSVALGEDVAKSLGTNIFRTRTLVVVAVTLLCGAGVAAAGPIGFIGLVVPHIARWIVGPEQRWIIAYSVVFGAILLLVADTVGRVIAPPTEIQAGLVTAFIGAPVLIALVRRRTASGL